MDKIRRKILETGGAGLLAATVPASLAFAQGTPLKIGMSMPLTGGLGGGGQAALLALKMWVEDTNNKGGLLGRKIEFTSYDDQSNPANTPAIYTKLLDVDKVDLLIAPYATGPTAPIMPLVKQRKKLLMGNFSFQVNAKTKHDMWFNNAPWNTADGWAKGFMEAAKSAGGKTVAILAEDGEFAQNLADGARPYFKSLGLNVVFDQNYPPTTKDFSSLVRAIRSSKAEIVFIASYPAASAAIVNSISEIGLGPQALIVGGGMVGLQFTPIAVNLGSKLNGIVNYHSYVPGMPTPGVDEFLKRYTVRAKEAKVDELGFYLAPFNYATGEMLAQAITATKSIEDAKLADYIHKNEMKTIVGPIRYDADGEWSKPRLLTTQFRGVKDKDQEQFRSPQRQVILAPAADKTGNFIAPFDVARKGS
ncbi:MAG: amino acid ABC transporter substrate-binding protein [Burkholderiales bacterium]|nr:amino acid ABC transporter substrate-binding protein [Burkholderiales bacterium]